MRHTAPTISALLALCALSACSSDPAMDDPAGDAADAGDAWLDAGEDAGEADSGSSDLVDTGADQDDDAGADVDPPPPPRDFLDAYDIDVPFAEGGVYDPETHAFFVGSLETGGVYRIDANTAEVSQVYTEERPGEWWTMGLGLDVERRVLWACSMSDLRGEEKPDDAPDNLGWALALDADTGATLALHDLTEIVDDANCADITTGPDGTAYVADRALPNVYAISPAGEMALLASGDELAGDVVGQNGITTIPDGSGLLAITYLTPKLVHVALPGGELTQVDIEGDFFDFIPPLSGADGVTWSGDSALVMFSSQLNRITPTSEDWSTADSLSIDTETGMTDVIDTPGGVYILNGQPLTFALEGDPDPTRLVRIAPP